MKLICATVRCGGYCDALSRPCIKEGLISLEARSVDSRRPSASRYCTNSTELREAPYSKVMHIPEYSLHLVTSVLCPFLSCRTMSQKCFLIGLLHSKICWEFSVVNILYVFAKLKWNHKTDNWIQLTITFMICEFLIFPFLTVWCNLSFIGNI